MSTFSNNYNDVKKATIDMFVKEFKNYVIHINTKKEIVESQMYSRPMPEDYYFKGCISPDEIMPLADKITFKFMHIDIVMFFNIYPEFSGETALIEVCKNAIEIEKSPDKKLYYLKNLDIGFESRLSDYTYNFKGIPKTDQYKPNFGKDMDTWLHLLKNNLFLPEKKEILDPDKSR